MAVRKPEIIITKSNGDEAVFSEDRFKASLHNAGASNEQIAMVLGALRKKLYPGMSTRQIYKLAFSLLRSSSRPVAARYNLKQAIMELGPSGFPFELFVSAILAHEGYRVKTGVFENGKCVRHEVDVRAEKDHTVCFVECKYHNHTGIDCDVKVPLYIHSRFNDIRSAYEANPGNNGKTYIGWVITNTHFTRDAITYGNCAGLRLLSWDYPITNGLKDIIDRTGLYPVTCLTSITKSEKRLLLESGIVLCREILERPRLLKNLRLSPPRERALRDELEKLCREISKG